MFITGLHSMEHQSCLIYKPISAISAPSLLQADLRKHEISQLQDFRAIPAPPNNYLSSQEHPFRCHLSSTSWIELK